MYRANIMAANVAAAASCSLLLVAALPLFYPLLTEFGGGVSGGGSAPVQLADQECVASLESLLDCLAYAQGKVATPSPTCCSNVDKVFLSHKKCLCELIAASFDQPAGSASSSGLPPFNRTIALHMPSACNVPADPALCPGLLGIPPSSPEAKEFESASMTANGTNLVSPSHSNGSTISNISMKSKSPSIRSMPFPFISLIGGFVIMFHLYYFV